ncbi:phosphoserine transaminase [Candidatus Paracaedibacter symbiosus]|uniref:phosphoserine transaminase n=1 Tax=Candidatus Paracaedibacter symbiosus TaxID=244582 RepID=UPI0005093EB1
MPIKQPFQKPQSPLFGSGPTKKFPDWTWGHLDNALLGRSHRSVEGNKRLQEVTDLTRTILEVPESYQIAIMAGSATGAIEAALWTLLGSRGVDVFAWDVFGKLWVTDVVQQLAIQDRRIFEADFGELPDLSQYNPQRDVVFTWNGTSAGVCVPNLDWIPENREGLSICDATSSAFTLPLEWNKLDVTAFSWQKGLGSEAAHGMLVLSPRALDQLQHYTPSWPIPRLFRLTKGKQLIDGIFIGKTINTPSMLCAEDYLAALSWAKEIGGQKALTTRTLSNFKVLDVWLDNHPHLEYLATDKATTSPISVCFKLKESTVSKAQQAEIIQKICLQLAELGVALEIKNHYLAPASFRIWCGPTVEAEDLERLTPWIDWALSYFV